ncbi:MAG: pyruvate formate lyase-activating protein [Chloroflexi bacterium]|nr:pyruvate formate lyase-activating protein [Chloroflexota bacterium]
MRILALDIGTGTQDILAFDSSIVVTNCPKMVMPSPTAILRERIQNATARRQALLFTGVTMGGGPAKGALRRHLQSGAQAYATPEAAKTFDDDLDEMRRMGAIIVSEDEARRLQGVEAYEMKDVDLPAIRQALETLGVSFKFDVLAVAVLDHGEAPPHMSDRLFRFQHMQQTLESRNRLSSFVYLSSEVPHYLTRMKAVLKTVGPDWRTLLMDTGGAAVLGAQEDPVVRSHVDKVVLNAGNSHVIAFHLHRDDIQGMFEHHTHALSGHEIESLVVKLTSGKLTNKEVFESRGHGAVVLGHDRRKHFLTVVGPQRHKLSSSVLKPYFAVPHGDMMITGCFGLVKACALRMDDWRDEIQHALSRTEEAGEC